MNLYPKLLVLLFSFSAFSVKAQNIDSSTLAKHVSSSLGYLNENFPQEKVFVQTDRNYYAAGETIWMKAWLTLDGRPSYLSRILYIDLADEKGNVVEKKMLHLDNSSSTAADLLLPRNLPTGNYQLRAYSLWMLNFPQLVFSQLLFVAGPQPIKTSSLNEKVLMQFFPEGGELVNGLTSNVAFKITDASGNGVNTRGIIRNNNGKEIAKINSAHNGMGSFAINPEEGNSYTAEIEFNNNQLKFSLPGVKKEGVVITVNNTSPNRVFVLLSKQTPNPSSLNKLLLVAQMHNTVVFTGEINFEEGNTAAAISKKNLPPGIMQITVFDEKRNPLAERVVFIKNIITADATINTSHKLLDKKSKHEIDISISSPAATDVSLLVTDYTSDSISGKENILTSLLLTSDLKGHIDNPDYYFRNNDSLTNKNLDLLLLTHGWRRFRWQEILASEFPKLKYPVQSSLAIMGKVTKPGGKIPITDGKVTMIIKTEDSVTLLSEAAVTDKGEFIVDGLNFRKAASVAYQGTNNKKQRFVVDVDIYPVYFDTLKRTTPFTSASGYQQLHDAAALSNYLKNQLRQNDSVQSKEMLENVTVYSKKISKEDSLNKSYASDLFQMGGRKLDPANKAYFSLWQFIRTVPGFVVEGDPKDPKVTLSRMAGINTFASSTETESATFADAEGNDASQVANNVENGIAFFLNEMPVSRDVLDNLSMSDIAFIKTYVGPESSVIGPYMGVVAVYTNKGVGTSILDKTFTTVKMKGYSITREFYAPDYERQPALINEPDNRITIYWNPKLKLNNGKAHIKFFNNDHSKKLRIIIQGIDADGRLIYKEQILEN